MKGTLVALDHLDGREAAALMVDGRLQDLLIAPESDAPPVPGSVFRAVFDRPMKGQGGAIVRLPNGSGFLRQSKGLAPGQSLLVQVTGYAEPGKAVPVTAKVLFKSRYAIVTPFARGLNISRSIRDDVRRDELLVIAHDEMQDVAFGLILRSACEDADEVDIAEDIAAMRDQAAQILQDGDGKTAKLLLEGPTPHALAWRDWDQPDLVANQSGSFEDHGVLDAMDALMHVDVPLSSGASLYVEPTRALVAVDVNTGADTSPAAGLKANLACARELPRQLRLRGLGGQVTIDFAPMAKKERRTVENALRSAFRADVIETALVGWTPLGHYELQRKRERLPVRDAIAG